MSVLTTTPKFLYPKSRQFPFDEVAEKIVRAIEKRNWKVPGITVDFYCYGSGEAKYYMVSSIKGDNFKLYFSRNQGKLDNHWYDVAAVHNICIPKQIMEVYADESGPTYYLYVGKNWEADKEWFMNSTKVHSKLNKEPRRYLKYEGNTYQQRATELVSDNDLNREYSPKGKELARMNLEEKFGEFTAWLKKFVLEYILTFEEADTIEPPISAEELIPYKGPWVTVYSICGWREAERIKKGQENPTELPPEERHAYIGSGHRLVPLDVKCDGRFPKKACEGFIWCDVNQEEKVTQNAEFVNEVKSSMRTFHKPKYIVAIKLKYANQVYVVDNSKYEETRKQLFKDIAPRERLTDEELGNAFASRGATIVSITEYKGDYKEPIVLIDRELDFDEVEVLSELKK